MNTETTTFTGVLDSPVPFRELTPEEWAALAAKPEAEVAYATSDEDMSDDAPAVETDYLSPTLH